MPINVSLLALTPVFILRAKMAGETRVHSPTDLHMNTAGHQEELTLNCGQSINLTSCTHHPAKSSASTDAAYKTCIRMPSIPFLGGA